MNIHSSASLGTQELIKEDQSGHEIELLDDHFKGGWGEFKKIQVQLYHSENQTFLDLKGACAPNNSIN